MHGGQFAEAIEYFEKALLLCQSQRHSHAGGDRFQSSGVAMRCHAAWTLWFLGEPDLALERMREALTLAHDLAEPHGLAHAFYFASMLHHFVEWLALMRHYGAPTRLMDWTWSFYVAVFFAMHDIPPESEDNCAVWALNLDELRK